jgi:methylenetetrahydrofolate dehydrogenase (NADP+)/methenyltetrahydrofolate cyclohydrolase
MAEAIVIDGKVVAARVRQGVAAAAVELRARHGIVPGLAAILVGDNPASQMYVRSKARACAVAGIASFEHSLPEATAEAEVIALIERLDADERVDGILVQLPLPSTIAPQRVIDAIDPQKDVDGFHPLNIGRLWSGQPTLVPCTPQGCLILLKTVHSSLAGAEAVIVGRSHIVGRVTHSKTRDVPAICRRADILIAASGQPAMVKAEWVKRGATVIDVGISQVVAPDGTTRLVGDVDFAKVRAVAGAITPVPGGVGPMTIACLLRNTVIAACRRRGLSDPPELS